MNEKLVLQDLVEALSKKAKISKKDADLFFRELFQLILERIYENDLVKIKDFGTFKLTSISRRESVDVNTGEKIEIPAHQRLSFLPDKILKNLVNKPFSQFETILLEEGVDFGVAENEIDEDLEEDLEDLSSIDIDEANDVLVEIDDSPSENSLTSKGGVVDELASKEDKNELDSNPRRISKSFIYTYTSGSETKSVSISVPKEDLISMPRPRSNRSTANPSNENKIELEKKQSSLTTESNPIINNEVNQLVEIRSKPIRNIIIIMNNCGWVCLSVHYLYARIFAHES